jgi:hypothetical protein
MLGLAKRCKVISRMVIVIHRNLGRDERMFAGAAAVYLNVGSVRRSAGASPGRNVLGQREPHRVAVVLR